MKDFREKLERLINNESMENGSNTPDFILAEYLTDCLQAFNCAVNKREEWKSNEQKAVLRILDGEGNITNFVNLNSE